MEARIASAPVLSLVALAALASPLLAAPQPPRPEHEVTRQGLVYRVPGMDRVRIRRDLSFTATRGGERKFDLYLPAVEGRAPLPAVVFINGVGDPPGGERLKDWTVYREWCALVAAHGWIGVMAEARGPFRESGPDVRDLLLHLHANARSLGIDPDRIAAWVCSGNVTSGLPVLMDEKLSFVKCAVVYYGNAELPAIRTDLPVLLVRAGRDNPRLNEGIDRMAARAASEKAPWTVVYAPRLHHAFDILDETEESRRVVRDTVAFFQEHLAPPPGGAPEPSAARRALAFWFAREYAEAAAAYAEYTASHPDDETAWLRLGISQAHARRAGEAEQSLRRAVAAGADRPLDLYNVACGLALAGRAEAALDHLERAAAAGFGTRRILSEDDDLASLRDLPRFKALLERLPPG